MKTSGSESVSTKQSRIAEQATACPDMVFTTLHHHIDIEWMPGAWNGVRRDGATGVDGVTAEDYETDLGARLLDLMERIRSGSYHAPPVRRHFIPKGDGTERPLGIPTLEDKVAQRAILMLLEPIYEEDFLPCSFGFRPGHSAHMALAALRTGLAAEGLAWVIDADISKCFDSIDHRHLRGFLDLRINDGVVRRMIDRWLKAGVLDAGVLQRPETGTPQGGVISPLLSSIFLHHVLDRWMADEAAPRIGACRLVRYADDFVMAFRNRRDGERVLAVPGRRLARYGLELHPAKTRFVDFRRRPGVGHDGRSRFDFPGFTHLWGRSRNGHLVVRQLTARDRFARAVRSVWDWCRRNRHLPIADQHRHLAGVIRGHCGYYGLTGNRARLSGFRHLVTRAWRHWLSRRHRGNRRTWAWFRTAVLARLPMPPARVVHSIHAR